MDTAGRWCWTVSWGKKGFTGQRQWGACKDACMGMHMGARMHTVQRRGAWMHARMHGARDGGQGCTHACKDGMQGWGEWMHTRVQGWGAQIRRMHGSTGAKTGRTNARRGAKMGRVHHAWVQRCHRLRLCSQWGETPEVQAQTFTPLTR